VGRELEKLEIEEKGRGGGDREQGGVARQGR